MVFPGDVWPEGDCCEICGVELGDEVVIQEFADGSLVRLCAECAAGAALSEHDGGASKERSILWPEASAEVSAARSGDSDPDPEQGPLDKTRELLMPVTDLIALQGEMQSALERLAASLERFATEMLTESQGKTAVESRLQILEHELDKTRAQLQKTEFLVVPPAPGDAMPVSDAAVPATGAEPAAATGAGQVDPLEFTIEPELPSALEDQVPATLEPVLVAPPTESGMTESSFAATTQAPDAAEEPAAPGLAAGAAPTAGAEQDQPSGFRIEEVQSAQRYYNESPFTTRIRDVRRSLGKPKANLTRVPGAEPRAVVTIAWDIVWYQYLVDLRRDLPGDQERVVLHREGMDLSELPHYFKEKNAVVNDDGRLDASELEVRLLSDPSALITEMSDDEKRLLEDATEEIWDQRVAPEFKWDD